MNGLNKRIIFILLIVIMGIHIDNHRYELTPLLLHSGNKELKSNGIDLNNEIDLNNFKKSNFGLTTVAFLPDNLIENLSNKFNQHLLLNHILALIFLIIIIVFLFHFRIKYLKRSIGILLKKDIIAKDIKRQKEILDHRNKNIEDSLNYAQRIQKAMLITHKQFKEILPNSFILYKSKDIVSGDFYWISKDEDKIFIAAADCTGHSVPGAFMSLIGFELFRKIINTQNIHDPAKILESLNQNFNDIFGNEENITLKDGMDLAFCVLYPEKNYLEFAGAFNPLYIIRNDKLIEIKGDHYPIGAEFIDGQPVVNIFTNHKVFLEPEDMVYMFSDGYADQFGGPEGKKFKYRRFRHLLLTIHKLQLDKQQEFLEETLDDWKGNLEQIDDILIIGFKHKIQ